MSLDGLRAWIGVVERKLIMRTRVFLVLVAIAVGGAGAAVYLAIEANDSSVSEAELQAVRDEVAASAAETPASDVSQLETELRALQSEVATLRSEQAAESKKDGGAAPESSGNGKRGK